MTDFYTVLRSALDKVGAADNEQRDRVYEHVREVMVRKLRNHRPPVGETEIASRVVSFEAAIDRIESEIADDEQAAIADGSFERREQLQQVGEYQPAGYDEEIDPGEPYADGSPISDVDAEWGDDRYADPDIAHSPDSPGELAPLEVGPEAPEPMWGVPAIDMAWDESREQWRDARRPPDPFANDVEVGDREGTRPAGRADRPSAGRSGGLSRWAKLSQRRSKSPPPRSAPDGDSDEDFVVQTPRSGRRRPGSSSRVRGWFGRLWPAPRRRPDLDDREERNRSDGDGRRGRRATSGSVDRRRRSKARAKKDEARAQRRGRNKESDDDPIAELARQLQASRGGYERSEPLLLEPPPASSTGGLFLPSPDRFENNEQEEQRPQEPPRRRRGRLFGGAGAGERLPDGAPADPPNSLGMDASEPFESEDEPRIRRRGRSRRTHENRGVGRARSSAAAGRPIRRSGRRGLWIGVVFVFGAGIIAWSASVFLPVLFPSDPDSETAPPPPAPAAETLEAPATPLVVSGGGIVMFDGGDPSVFEGAADNPTNYLPDVGGGIVRITSTINSGGARLAIGRDAANNLAGHQVRLVMEARGTPDQAAAAVRLAYQQDLIILDWRLARLIGDFAIITATWTVPSREVDGTDFLIIEPGVAGDGTAIDVRSIRFELLD